MKKPILGIIGICLLQVAFVAYNAFELPVDMSAVTPVREIAQAPAALDQPEDDIVVFRSRNSASEAPPLKRIATARVLNAIERDQRPTARLEPKRPRMILAAQRSPIRTEYPIAPLEHNDSNRTLSGSVVTKQAKKKSFFSRALPIIKKPYDWAKAFAGKLK